MTNEQANEVRAALQHWRQTKNDAESRGAELTDLIRSLARTIDLLTKERDALEVNFNLAGAQLAHVMRDHDVERFTDAGQVFTRGYDRIGVADAPSLVG